MIKYKTGKTPDGPLTSPDPSLVWLVSGFREDEKIPETATGKLSKTYRIFR